MKYDDDGKLITCENDMEKICKESPDLMIELLLKDSFHYCDLTFAAEIAGRLLPSEKIVPILKDLLYHSSAVVREGAMYGLSYHFKEDN